MERPEDIWEIMEAMSQLKLYGMRAGFDEITGPDRVRGGWRGATISIRSSPV